MKVWVEIMAIRRSQRFCDFASLWRRSRLGFSNKYSPRIFGAEVSTKSQLFIYLRFLM